MKAVVAIRRASEREREPYRPEGERDRLQRMEAEARPAIPFEKEATDSPVRQTQQASCAQGSILPYPTDRADDFLAVRGQSHPTAEAETDDAEVIAVKRRRKLRLVRHEAAA